MYKRLKLVGILLCIICCCMKKTVYAGQENMLQHGAMEIQAGEISLFEDGDIVGFIGDSITHARYCDVGYVEALNMYYMCRFPERMVEFRNLGVAGYKASDMLKIYDLDRGFQGINKAVIMLGTNEAVMGYSAARYIKDMDKLIANLKDSGVEAEDILILTSPVCDEKFVSEAKYAIEGRILEYIEQLETKVPKWGVQYLDIHTPMVEMTKEIQEENPDSTLTNGDGLHPGQNGQMLIAYYLLWAQNVKNSIQDKECVLGIPVHISIPMVKMEEVKNFLAFYEPATVMY